MSVQSVLFVHLTFLYGPPPHAPGEFMRGWEPLQPPAGAPPCTPGIYAELGAPAPPDAGAPPCTRVTFLRKESHQRFARNLLVLDFEEVLTSGEGGGSKSVPL